MHRFSSTRRIGVSDCRETRGIILQLRGIILISSIFCGHVIDIVSRCVGIGEDEQPDGLGQLVRAVVRQMECFRFNSWLRKSCSPISLLRIIYNTKNIVKRWGNLGPCSIRRKRRFRIREFNYWFSRTDNILFLYRLMCPNEIFQLVINKLTERRRYFSEVNSYTNSSFNSSTKF